MKRWWRARTVELVPASLEDWMWDRYFHNKLKNLPPHVAENLDRARYYGMDGPRMMADWPVLKQPWLDAVADYSADPTFGSDCTSQLNSWLGASAPSNLTASGGVNVVRFLPPGQYKITDVLTQPAPQVGISIVGGGKYQSLIEQQTDGKHIFVRQENSVGTGDSHTFSIKGVGMGYKSSLQGSTNANNVAVWLSKGSGLFGDNYKDILLWNCYKGWGVDSTAVNPIAIWATTWEDVTAFETKQSVIDLNYTGVGGVAGQPNLSLRDFYVFNSAVVPSGPMFIFEAVNEVRLDRMDLEGWYNEIVQMDSGYLFGTGIHLENNFLSNAFARFFLISNGTMNFDALTVSATGTYGTTVANSDAAVIAWLNISGQVEIRGGFYNVDTTRGSSYIREVVFGAPINQNNAYVYNFTKQGGGLNDYVGNFHTNTLVAPTGISVPLKDSIILSRKFVIPSGTGVRLSSGSSFRVI